MTPLLVLVFMQPPDLGKPLAEALVRAAEQALGPAASVVFRSPPGAGSDAPDATLLQAGRAEDAFAVARVSWRADDANRAAQAGPAARGERRFDGARVSVTIVRTGRQSSRSVSFFARDALAERGRAVGLIVAALVEPERPARADQGGAPASSRAIAPAHEGVVADSAGAPAGGQPQAQRDGARVPRQEQAVPDRAPETTPTTVATSPSKTTPTTTPAAWALDAIGEQTIALGGDGSGTGGGIGLRWAPSRHLAFRAGLGGRFGEVGAAQASSRALAVAVGVVLPLLPRRASEDDAHFGLGLRADLQLLNESLSHLSADDPSPVRASRWLPAAGLRAEAEWRFAPSVGLLADVGPEVAFGKTTVFVHETPVTTLAPLRLVMGVGLLAHF